MILEFAAPEDEEIAFVEYQMGDSIIDGGAHLVAPYLKKFWSLETVSASVEESVALVEGSLRKLCGGLDANRLKVQKGLMRQNA